MCGITGFNWNHEDKVKEMTDCIAHRGPDSEGHYTDSDVSLGHRRLSILDLSELGRQPMKYKDLIIVFNGEIYNYLDIKKDLIDLGHSFNSKTDTEVLLHAYDQWRESFVEKINGMWAFCIYDKKEKKLFLSRDRFGIKPLYYYFDSDKFIFSSELKAIVKHDLNLKIDKKALNFYFYQKYIGADLSIYKQVKKLRPATNLSFDLKMKEIKKFKCFHLEKEINKAKKISFNKRKKIIQEKLKTAVKKRLIADVPVGSFLSGGLDSSLISALIREKKSDLKTFSIGFKEDSYNELPYSKQVAKEIGTGHYIDYLQIDEKVIEEVLSSLDEPFGDPSLLPTYLLSKMTRKKVIVSLSGDGADEIFGGYDSYLGYKIAKLTPSFIVNLLKPIADLFPSSDRKLPLSFMFKKFVTDYSLNIVKRHFDWMASYPKKERKKLLSTNFIENREFIDLNNQNGLLSLQLADINNYLPEDILKKVDIASMLNSLETRVPYLDHELVPLVLSLPERLKIKRFNVKWFLKQIAEKYLPSGIINRKKRGFSVPISKWLRKSDLIQQYITEDKYYRHGLLSEEYVKKIYQEHLDKKKDNSRQLWLVFVFNYWSHNNEKK
jgi:asparagine synthase (glutamine-hydrolysing)